MADQAGIPIRLRHLAANRMIVGEFDGWLIEHVLQVVQAERLERRAEAMHIIFVTKLAQQQPHGLMVNTPTCRAAGEHEISRRPFGGSISAGWPSLRPIVG